MKNSEIIQYIDRFCAHNEELDTISNADLAYAILAHGYLYVRPGKHTDKFTVNVIEALKVGAATGFNNYLENGSDMWLLDEWVRNSIASSALKIARKMFDQKYFEKQIASLDPEEVCDNSLLDKYLNLMNKEQLQAFMDDVSSCRANYVAFSNFDFGFEIMDELNERCRTVNALIPATASGYQYVSFRQKNPYYLFDYLSKEEIVDAIKRGIVWNKSLAGHLARMTYHTNGLGVMDSYIELISTYERVFGRDIYNPDIFCEDL